ncbi:hypothetical protein HZ996_02610 [Cryomorphaceae bacterium]|nr:hypothetical protein HZ996_02610 [Cryomorphaceae bacterium]
MGKVHRIINVKNITSDMLESIKHTYPYGYDDDDMIKFVNAAGETVSALPIETEDGDYLIKMNVEMINAIDAFLDEGGDDDAQGEELEAEAPDSAAED